LLTEVSTASTDLFSEELAALSNNDYPAASDVTQPTQAQV